MSGSTKFYLGLSCQGLDQKSLNLEGLDRNRLIILGDIEWLDKHLRLLIKLESNLLAKTGANFFLFIGTF